MSQTSGNENSNKQKVFRTLGKTGLMYIILVSTVVTAVFTAFSVYSDYQLGLQDLKKEELEIEQTHLESVADALWTFNEKQIEKQIAGLVSRNNITYVHVDGLESNIEVETGIKQEGALVYFHSYPLLNEGQNLGEMKVQFTKQNIIDKLKAQTIRFFFLQGIKTLITSLIILYIFDKLVTRHLVRISRFISTQNLGSRNKLPHYASRRDFNFRDELTDLETGLNHFVDSLNQSNERLYNKLDVQEAKALQSAQLASLGEMAGGIAHEINNPLAILSMSFDQIKAMISRDNFTKENILKVCERGVTTVRRLSKIVDGLMKFARDGSGDDVEACSIHELLDEVRVYFEEKSKKSGVSFDIVSDKEDWGFASARYVQLQQVLVNLLNNAYYEVKKLEEQWIRLEIEHTEDNIYIRVVDSGKGIPPEVAKKIMSPFYTTKPVGEGTGLGLSISKGVLETFDGDLFLDMDHKNTCFVIKLKQDLDEITNAGSEKVS